MPMSPADAATSMKEKPSTVDLNVRSVKAPVGRGILPALPAKVQEGITSID